MAWRPLPSRLPPTLTTRAAAPVPSGKVQARGDPAAIIPVPTSFNLATLSDGNLRPCRNISPLQSSRPTMHPIRACWARSRRGRTAGAHLKNPSGTQRRPNANQCRRTGIRFPAIPCPEASRCGLIWSGSRLHCAASAGTLSALDGQSSETTDPGSSP